MLHGRKSISVKNLFFICSEDLAHTNVADDFRSNCYDMTYTSINKYFKTYIAYSLH